MSSCHNIISQYYCHAVGEMIDRELSLANLVSQLSNSHLQLQLNALVLINNLLQYASPQRKPNMVSTFL